ncbi:unnamed protein product [Blepharisma stoltei]|uniref:Uncharacterized protein n=1 Tax=Blepharisma stoltei TaxID=1481888 RepID=A0AAU9K738_9CILI|nr:unnamed protein product [Blepharisma stoltei]
MIHIRRLFSSAVLPWKFSNSKAYELPLANGELNVELLKEKDSFLYVYDEILKSYENQDIGWLEDVMEPNLFKKLQSGMQEIKANEKKIQIINEKESTDVTYHNAVCLVGVNIDRSKNKIETNPVENTFNYGRVPNLLLYGPDGSIILRVSALYASKKKLALFDKSNNLIEGDNNDDIEYHKFQFEKMVQYKFMIRDFLKFINWNILEGKDPFEDSEWIITDIDDSLDGNPILVSARKKS